MEFLMFGLGNGTKGYDVLNPKSFLIKIGKLCSRKAFYVNCSFVLLQFCFYNLKFIKSVWISFCFFLEKILKCKFGLFLKKKCGKNYLSNRL